MEVKSKHVVSCILRTQVCVTYVVPVAHVQGFHVEVETHHVVNTACGRGHLNPGVGVRGCACVHVCVCVVWGMFP